jgi:hypothetical protein
MRTFLHIIWFSLPAIYVFIAIYSKFEQWQGQARREHVGDHTKSAIFTLVCAIIALVIDLYFLESILKTVGLGDLPILFFQIILYPFVLLAGAKLWGGTPDQKIPPPNLRRRQ